MTRISIDLEGVVGHGYLEITDKLRECRFFLDLMRRTTDWNQFRWLTSACLNAARAAMDWLAWSAYYAWTDDDGQMQLDEKALATLREYLVLKQQTKSGKIYVSPRHPLLKTLCGYRRITAHEGSLWIKPEIVTDSKEFRFWRDDKSVLEVATGVLDLLTQIQNEIRPDFHRAGSGV